LQKGLLSSAGNKKRLPFLRILLAKLKPSKFSLSSAERNHLKETNLCSFTGELSHMGLVCFSWFGIFFTHVLLQNHSMEFKDNLNKFVIEDFSQF